MFLLDVKVSGWGLSIGALIAFGLGSLLIFTPPWAAAADTRVRLNPWMIVVPRLAWGPFSSWEYQPRSRLISSRRSWAVTC